MKQVCELCLLCLQIFIWSKDYQENWSAFAPDFKVQPFKTPLSVEHGDDAMTTLNEKRLCHSLLPSMCQQELEANEEYVEREDEFDVNERPASPTANECAPACVSEP